MRIRAAFVLLVIAHVGLAQTTPIRVGLFAGLNREPVIWRS